MNEEKNSSMFLSLIFTFQAAAMQQMGKIKNPLSDKIEKNLDQAQLSIDMLDMIENKTRGNLTDEENKLLKNVLQELKLNYVDEVSKENKSEEGETK
jgi:hypothetical protein